MPKPGPRRNRGPDGSVPQYVYETYTMPYRKSSSRPKPSSTASPGVAYAATKLTAKLSLSDQSMYQSSSVARSSELTPADSVLSRLKSRKIRPVLMFSEGLVCRRSWCVMRLEFDAKYSPAISPCHQVPQS